jgi:hypothetical protein
MKKNEINEELSIEEKKKILLAAIESTQPAKKKEALLAPFIPEIKLMLEKKMPLSAQLKALDSIGIKIAYKTYKTFLNSLTETKSQTKFSGAQINGAQPAAAEVKKDAKEPAGIENQRSSNITIVLNDKGDVKTYAVKDAVKKLGFAWDKDRKGWKKEVSREESEKIKELKVGYDII